MTEAQNTRELTFGEKAVGLTFNPGGDPSVTKVKEMYAEIIDFLDTARQNTKDGGKIRHLSTAITDAETAQMRAVKGLTWNS